MNDVWPIVFSFIKDKKTGLGLKNTCKDSYIGFIDYVKTTEKTIPRCTFIKINECMLCGKVTDDVNTIVYNEYYPRRMILYCSKWTCFCSALKTYLKDMIIEKKYGIEKDLESTENKSCAQ